MPVADLRSGSITAWVPLWWAGEGGPAGAVLNVLLWPAEQAYHLAVRARNTAYDRGWLVEASAPIPVISIGNISVGGAGKTPFTAWLAEYLDVAGRRPAVVLRGYGRDEILVHRELNPNVPVFAARRRIDGVREAAAAGCDIAILDDGFQHRAVSRDLDILLVAADSWRSPQRLLPRGPWRETLTMAGRRADLVVATRKSPVTRHVPALKSAIRAAIGRTPVVECSIRPAGLQPLQTKGDRVTRVSLRGMRVLAVAALAAPEPFVGNLEELGCEAELIAFPDHHEFTADEAASLGHHAGIRPIVMTLKDAVKLRPLIHAAQPAYVLMQRVELTDGAEHLLGAVENLLMRRERIR
ncbi:tetraacyldisaccharide 4'-kinase [soil metagenome]